MKTVTKKLSVLLVAVICMVSMISMTVNATVNAIPLALNQEFVYTNVITDEDTTYYSVTLPSDGKITVSVQTMAEVDYAFCNPDLTTTYFSGNLGGGSEVSPVTTSKTEYFSAGVYIIKLAKNRWDDGGRVGVKVVFDPTNNQEAEPNNSFAQAMPLTAGTQIKGVITWNDDVDFYKVTMPVAGPFAVEYINSMADSRVVMYRSNYEEVFNKHYGGGSEAAPRTESYVGTLEAGEYYIKVQKDWNVEGTYYLTFKNVGPNAVALNKTSLTMTDGQEFQLSAKVMPENAISTNVVWSTTDSWIANVDNTGKVTANGVGVATITATSDVDETVKATCKVIVKPAQVTGLSQSISLTKQTSTTISWYSTSGADGYRVYKYDTKKKKYVKYKDTTSTSLKISKLKAEKSYKFKVAAYIKDGSKKIVGKQSAALTAFTAPKKLAATKITSVKRYKRTTYYNYITVKWNKVKGATGYKVYGKQPGGDWRLIVTTSSRSAKLYAGRGYTYQIKVCAYRTKNGLTTDGKFSKVKKYTSK